MLHLKKLVGSTGDGDGWQEYSWQRDSTSSFLRGKSLIHGF